MSLAVMVIGKSGSGKSTSCRNLDPKETFLIKCTNKELPFKGGESRYKLLTKENPEGNLFVSNNADNISKILIHVSEKMPQIKNIIIDDFQYVLGFEFIKRIKEKGYEKFNDIAAHAFDIVDTAKNKLRDDLFTAILTHSEENIVGGETVIKLKTIGEHFA